MKILVPVKRVIDPSFKVRLKPDHSGLDMDYMKMVMNPYDEVALEEALSLKERGIATSVLVVFCGAEDGVETLRTGLAMGADEALWVEAQYALSPLVVARLLKAVALREGCSLALVGRQGMGNDGNQVGPMLAALLDWPCLPFAEQLSVEGGQADAKIRVRSKTDHGYEVLVAQGPAVISVEIGLNTPRYATMPNLMKAKKKKVPGIPASELGVDLGMQVAVAQLRNPPERTRGAVLPDAAALIARLRSDTHVI